MSPRSASATGGWASPDAAIDTPQRSSVMFTVCPKCALTLVVTTEDLRVAQGYVRCGRCSSVFNALARLTEEGQVSEESVETAPPAAAASQIPSPAPPNAPPQSVTDEDAIPEEALEFDPTQTDVASVFVEPPPNPQWTTGTFKAMVAANQEAAPAQDSDSQIDVEIDPELLASILHFDLPEPLAPPEAAPPAPREPPPPAAREAAPPVPRETPRPAAREAAPPAPREPSPPAAREAAPPVPRETPPPASRQASPSAAAQEAPRPAAREAATAGPASAAPVRARSAPSQARTPRKMRLGEDLSASTGMSRLLPHLWRAGTGLALLLLLAQIVNHYRDELAATARFHRPLTALYASLGVPLAPHWDLRAYEVRQLGASVEPASAGLITVRASVKNAAAQPQPLPVLRVTLQDRFGNRIAARDVAPPLYLPHATPGPAFLSAGQRIDAEMGFVDPGANAVGFEIDACLPASGGEVTCANDAIAR
ncbi:MAG: DUF3426 domain-containing protein [Gammaproteobacteria bacterium]|nr:MAG: DUF3426 domain-containing protein [Gammaproteobacteria bacterium]TLY85411.1 MAG: DUF3426 domain-containing protein [Gammaproteobacteria bacterium]